MSNIEIKCLHDEVWPLEKFVENPRNPNRHPVNQLGVLGQVLLRAGWRSSIVVSKRSGFVIKGHGRLAAAKFMGMEEAPVSFQDYENEADEHADMIADNRIAELAETDSPALLELMAEIQNDNVDLPMTGFTDSEFQNMQLAQGRDDDEFEGIVPEGTKGKSAPGKAIRFLTFGEHKFPLSDAEYDELANRSEAHKATGGSTYEFASTLIPAQ